MSYSTIAFFDGGGNHAPLRYFFNILISDVLVMLFFPTMSDISTNQIV